MGYFERCKWREAKMPCKRTLSMPGWKTRMRLIIPGFGETHGVRAVGGGNPKGNAIMARFLHKITNRECNPKGTRRIGTPCQELL